MELINEDGAMFDSPLVDSSVSSTAGSVSRDSMFPSFFSLLVSISKTSTDTKKPPCTL